MESHNHPSFIEPYQGAATGVGGILRDVFTMGARPVASLELRCASARPTIPRPAISSPAWWRASAATAIRSACRRSAARSASTSATTATSSSTPWRSASRAPTRSSTPRRPGVGQSDRLSRLQDRPRRHPRRDHGLGRVRGRRGGEAPDRAGRRPLRREAAARSLPRTDGVGRGRRDPGHGRGGAHLVGRRDGRARATSASSSTSTACPAAKTA